MRRFTLLIVFFAIAGSASQNDVEPLVLNGDWRNIAAAVKAEPASEARVQHRLLLAHASLAASDVNSAFCGFAAVSSTADLNAWEQWTSALVRKSAASSTARYLHGDALARLQQFEAAIAEFNRALELDPHSSLAKNARGVVFVSTGRFDEALIDFSDVSAADPAFADAFINRGYLYIQRSGSAASQMKAFEAALQIRPDATLAIIGEGRATSATGRLIAGVDEVDQALHSCSTLDTLVVADRSKLFTWVNAELALLKPANPEKAGMTLDSALREIDLKRTPESVRQAFEVAQQSSDPRASEKLRFTLQSIMNSPDRRLRTSVQQGLDQERAINEQRVLSVSARPDQLRKEITTTTTNDAFLGLQLRAGGIKAGASSGLTDTVRTRISTQSDLSSIKASQLRDIQ